MGKRLNRPDKMVTMDFSFDTPEERQKWVDDNLDDYLDHSEPEFYEKEEKPQNRSFKSQHHPWSREWMDEAFLINTRGIKLNL